jgi:predicted Zn-dependent peptidase
MNKIVKEIKVDGFGTFRFMDIPNGNICSMSIANKHGSNIERETEGFYGISHFIEHLSFKSSKDYTSEEANYLCRNVYRSNAFTDFDTISYESQSSMSEWKQALNYLVNITYNDLNKVNQEEFDTEKNIVINEIIMYQNDPETSFHQNWNNVINNLNPNDNIGGSAEILQELTLEDVIKHKNYYLYKNDFVYEVMFDSTKEKQFIEKFIKKIKKYAKKFKLNKGSLFDVITKTEINADENKNHDYPVNYEGKMVKYSLKIETPYLMNIVTNYISSSAKNTSLNDIVREKHALTYGIHCNIDEEDNIPYMFIDTIITPDNKDNLDSAILESLELTYNNFNKKAYKEFIKNSESKRIHTMFNQYAYKGLFKFFTYSDIPKSFIDELGQDIDIAIEQLNGYKEFNYKNIKKGIKEIRDKFRDNEFTVYTTIKDE